MTIDQVLDDILAREGRQYTHRPADKGGPTKYGITQATLAAWRGRPVTPEDVQALTEPEAREILRRRYVEPWDWVPDDRLRVLLVDWAVTSWHDNPAKALQRAVGGLKVDGIAGPKTQASTIAALAAGRGPEIYAAVLRERIEYYVSLALDEPQLRVLMRTGPPMQIANLRGWIRRCAEFICGGVA